MVDIGSPDFDRIFGALANPTRRRLIRNLMDGPATVGDLAEPFDISLAGIAKHLQILESAGLISRTIEGRETRCQLIRGGLEGANSLLDEYRSFWEEQLESLEKHMKDPT